MNKTINKETRKMKGKKTRNRKKIKRASQEKKEEVDDECRFGYGGD